MHDRSSVTPMFRQYREHKHNHPGAILLFRMGDFYEMFYEDAQEASRLLNLTLTARGKGTDHAAPMCGFPHHQLDSYTAKLVRAGKSVAICDQVEDPRTAKGLVRRDVVRVVTPGTLTDPEELESRENSWIAAIAATGTALGASFLDVSTGEFLAWQSSADGDRWDALADRLLAFGPKEIVHPQDFPWSESFRAERTRSSVLTPQDPYTFAPGQAADLLARHFEVVSLDGFGLKERPAAIGAAGGLLAFLRETQKSSLRHIDGIALHEPSRHLLLDPATRRNLEIERSIRDGGRAGSLLHAMDATLTASGGRLLRQWLLAPLADPGEIAGRLDSIQELLSNPSARSGVRERLKQFHDVERLLGRAVAGTANARDLIALSDSLGRLPEIASALAGLSSPLVRGSLDGLDPCADVVARLGSALAESPPLGLREGGLVRDGFNAELDELRGIRRDGRAYIAALESRERGATGIASLKVRFNKVFGYYIEVSRPNLHLVPDHYQRKQTIAGGERFLTPELKEYEAKVLNAQERIETLEYEVFCAVRAEAAEHAHRIKAAAKVVSRIDVLAALAEIAAERGYCRPDVRQGTRLRILAGRHPVVERTLTEPRFVPNDTDLDSAGQAISILTGPNMGGKSTYLRQVGLIVLLAQAGSFVPADEAEVGVADRIFCRVGASDSLAEGQSTFMVEMIETANILHHAGRSSLVLLDEIGRGTATFDGMAIAWAVVESLHGRPGGPPRTLFATHYHELTELAVTLGGVVNHRMGARERGDRVLFLHRVEQGAADKSYGIQVARLAGIPQAVIARAKEILTNLERDEFGRDGLPRRARRQGRGATPGQPNLFAVYEPAAPPVEPGDPAVAEVLADLRLADTDRLTPLEALQKLAAWRRRLDEAE
jgi:DNA mismatch repair protein MutS